MTLTGSYDGDGSTRANYSLDFTATACSDGTRTMDGSLTWTGSVTGGGTNLMATETIDGAIAYQDSMYAGTWDFHGLTITTNVNGSAVSVSVTGDYTIGGKTYTVDGSWTAPGQ